MSIGDKMALASVLAMAMADGNFAYDMKEMMGEKNWKPEFTDEELAEIRSLPKKERKARVKELRAKYLEAEKPVAKVRGTDPHIIPVVDRKNYDIEYALRKPTIPAMVVMPETKNPDEVMFTQKLLADFGHGEQFAGRGETLTPEVLQNAFDQINKELGINSDKQKE